jgi:hypothetical protein
MYVCVIVACVDAVIIHCYGGGSSTLASALASIVLPVPGGPYSNTPVIIHSVHACVYIYCVIASLR